MGIACPFICLTLLTISYGLLCKRYRKPEIGVNIAQSKSNQCWVSIQKVKVQDSISPRQVVSCQHSARAHIFYYCLWHELRRISTSSCTRFIAFELGLSRKREGESYPRATWRLGHPTDAQKYEVHQNVQF